jgi:hypothetical protein
MRRKKVDETASRVVQEKVQRFVQLGPFWNQLGGYPSEARMKQPISLLRNHTHTENRKLRVICL